MHLLAHILHLGGEAFAEVPVHDAAEDQLHGLVLKVIDGEGVEVAQESWRDGVPPATGRTHSSNQNDVHQVDLKEHGAHGE